MTTDSLPPCTILVVDDEPAVRRATSRMLERAGYRVVEASDGLEALDLFSGSVRVDLVVSDVRMMPIDGAVLGGAVRHIYPDLACLLISASSDPRPKPDPTTFLAKPFTASELTSAVSKLLRRAAPAVPCAVDGAA